MPEGDTIHRAANRLRPALVGAELTEFEAARLVGERPMPGEHIESVDAVGKHLLIAFDGGLVLHTHMKMSGSWHLYRAGERWRRGYHLARAVVTVPDWQAVCFAAPVVGTWRPGTGQRSPVAHLGPDLCRGDIDFDADLGAIIARLEGIAESGSEIADVLLDQRVAAGIGNVFKSEALWACRISPFIPVEALSVDDIGAIYRTASRQLRSATATGARRTVATGLAVYDRAGRGCFRCDTAIEVTRQGDGARTTFWCPNCQPS